MSLTMTFEAKDEPNNKNNIRKEFYIPKPVTLDVLHFKIKLPRPTRCYQSTTKAHFPQPIGYMTHLL